MAKHKPLIAITRRGFAATALVLAVMASLNVIGLLCAKTLVAQRRYVEQTAFEAQLELMVVAALQWQQAGGEIASEETRRLVLSEGDAVTNCEIEMTRQGATLQGKATIRRNGRLVGTKNFTLSSFETR